MWRLTKREDEYTIRIGDECRCNDAVWRRLAQYEDLEEQGLLLRLPVKVGDTVYKISKNAHTSFRHIDKTTVVRIAIDKDGVYLFCARCSNAKTILGKTVFLTREEAEQKLKELEE